MSCIVTPAATFTEEQEQKALIRGATPRSFPPQQATQLKVPLLCLATVASVLSISVTGSGALSGVTCFLTYPDGFTDSALTDSNGRASFTLKGSGALTLRLIYTNYVTTDVALTVSGSGSVSVNLVKTCQTVPTLASASASGSSKVTVGAVKPVLPTFRLDNGVLLTFKLCDTLSTGSPPGFPTLSFSEQFFTGTPPSFPTLAFSEQFPTGTPPSFPTLAFSDDFSS